MRSRDLIAFASGVLPLLALPALLLHCSSSSNSSPPGDAGPDVVRHVIDSGGGGDDGGGDGGTTCTMTGSLDLTVTVMAEGLPPQPLAGALGRAENAKGDCAESMPAGPDGVVHIKVDPSKGPFDVTVAAEVAGDAGATVIYNAASILGQTGPVSGQVILAPVSSAGGSIQQAKVSGTISNQATYETGVDGGAPDGGSADAGSADGGAGTWQIQIDGWDFNTVVTPATSTSYSSTYEYDQHNLGPNALPLPLSAILVDPNGNAVAGVYTAATPRTGNAMGINIDFSQMPLTPTTSTIDIQFPTAGVLTGPALTTIGNPAAGNAFIGNAVVVKTTPLEHGAEQFVGVGNVTLPDSSGKSVFTLQEFPSPMNPDIAEAALFGKDYLVVVQPHDLTAGSTVDVGEVDKLSTTGTSLADTKFDVATNGYDAVEGFLSTPVTTNGGGGATLWVVYATGATLSSHGLPHMPSGVPFSDLAAGATTLTASAQVVKFAQGAPAAWQATTSDETVVAGAICDSTGCAQGAMVTTDGR